MVEQLGIIGYGIVGQAVTYGFRNHHPIYIYDKFKPDISKSLEEVVEKADILFVCLPTPMKKEQTGIDLTIIDNVIESIVTNIKESDKVITIKSTVVPGTTRSYAEKYPGINFAFNPEFLTEANYLDDFVHADRHVVGADSNKIRLRIGALYKNRFPDIPLYMTDLTTAEMVKYFANCYLATKVMFANEMYDLCQSLDIKYEETKKMVTADRRIEDSHLDVTSVHGFGGKCFPKDIVAMIGRAKELGVNVSLLETAWRRNLEIRKIRDWEEIPGAITDGRNYE